MFSGGFIVGVGSVRFTSLDWKNISESVIGPVDYKLIWNKNIVEIVQHENASRKILINKK